MTKYDEYMPPGVRLILPRILLPFSSSDEAHFASDFTPDDGAHFAHSFPSRKGGSVCEEKGSISVDTIALALDSPVRFDVEFV